MRYQSIGALAYHIPSARETEGIDHIKLYRPIESLVNLTLKSIELAKMYEMWRLPTA